LQEIIAAFHVLVNFVEIPPMSQPQANAETFDLSERHAHFNEDGSVTLIGAQQLWALPESEINARFGRLLVSSFSFSENWATWEMHPHGDELVCLTSGEATLILRDNGGDVAIPLYANCASVIPCGKWHTVHATVPCQLLIVTRGKDTQVLPASEMGAR
jgi:mannose-6-phosphate isomerase-like protein (cupin superfamily)